MAAMLQCRVVGLAGSERSVSREETREDSGYKRLDRWKGSAGNCDIDLDVRPDSSVDTLD